MKKGQVELSFGMIFSIIIVIATVAIAIYFIQKFLVSGECASVGIMKDELQNEINKIWASPFGVEAFTAKTGGGIEKICFGDLTKAGGKYAVVRDTLDRYSSPGDNFFIYPPEKACKGSFAAAKLSHVYSEEFNCFDVRDGKAEIKLSRESASQILVKICGGSVSCGAGVDNLNNPPENVNNSAQNSSSLLDLSTKCKRAADGNVCDSLVVSYGAEFRKKCCTDFSLCC